jgi:hypothetical protein
MIPEAKANAGPSAVLPPVCIYCADSLLISKLLNLLSPKYLSYDFPF